MCEDKKEGYILHADDNLVERATAIARTMGIRMRADMEAMVILNIHRTLSHYEKLDRQKEKQNND